MIPMRHSTLVVAAILLIQNLAANGLEPLKYNHPGLAVDLGVGLWAWPMPMDYDDDGDLDLLVACPDKPSNGVYYFENPTQNPKEKFPVFKPAVRLGPCTHNFQVSTVNNTPRILKPGFEYVDFKKNGFENPTKIYPRTNIHRGKTRANMWRYVDYDGDKDHDLIVGVGDWSDYEWDHAYDAQGRWRNGPLHGYVYLIENKGSDKTPDYAQNPKRIATRGNGASESSVTPVDVFGWPSPNFADFDNDGDLDLLCGEFLDGFTYFLNIGTRSEPVYASGRKIIAADGKPLVMDLQMITPTAIDWDQDNDLDLIVGDEDGRVALIENTGRSDFPTPHFKQPVYFQQVADTLKFGALATPFAYDWDNDGDEDILSGNSAGYIGFFENLGPGSDSLPIWAAPVRLEVDGKPHRILAGPNGSIQGPAEAKWGYSTLSVGDWKSTGTPHMFTNGIWGKIECLVKSGSGLSLTSPLLTEKTQDPAWTFWDPGHQELVTQWRTTPLIVDLPKGGRKELLMLDAEGYLALFGTDQIDFGPTYIKPGNRVFIDEDNQPIRLNNRTAGRSGRYKIAATDWDRDGRLDVLVNSENAAWYRNCEDRDGKIVLKKIGNLAERNVAGHTSSPALCDFDNDGKPDLLVGAENGRIYHIRHDDCIQFSKNQLQARPAQKPDPPRFPGLVMEEFIYTKAPFPQCHATTICETTRGLVAAMFGGTKEKNPDVGIWTSYNDGAGWSAPKQVADGIQYTTNDKTVRHPCWNPVLFQPPGDAPTMLFFKVGPNPREWWGELLLSYDRGRSWRDRRRLPEGIDGPVKNKPVLLDNGTLLCGSSTEFDNWRVHFELTNDLGQTWERVGPINDGIHINAIQPSFLTHPDGRLQALGRSQEKKIWTAFSKDHGLTWSKMSLLDLPNPNSGTDALTLADGRHLLVYNHTVRNQGEWQGRNMLNVALSEDGLNWSAAATLEQEKGAEFSYPAVIQSADGLIHITYTWKRQRPMHVVLDPTKLELTPIVDGIWPL
jgi:predicted neuraminidase